MEEFYTVVLKRVEGENPFLIGKKSFSINGEAVEVEGVGVFNAFDRERELLERIERLNGGYEL